MFSTVFSRPSFAGYHPGVNLFENDKEVMLEIELPGRKREDVSVEVADRTLTVSAKAAVVDREGYESGYRERHRVEFERSFRLGEDLDESKIQAKYENGLLLLSIPRSGRAQARKIEIA